MQLKGEDEEKRCDPAEDGRPPFGQLCELAEPHPSAST